MFLRSNPALGFKEISMQQPIIADDRNGAEPSELAHLGFSFARPAGISLAAICDDSTPLARSTVSR
jgi:hypothetical protein